MSAESAYLRARRAAEARLTAAHAYDPEMEHDACGVGLIAAIDGKPRRDVVLKGVEALKALWHRGAVDADGMTGDGAGIHVQIPRDFFEEHIDRTGHVLADAALAVGMTFLPRVDYEAQERCRVIVEREIIEAGHIVYGWRRVPVDVSVIGEKANATRPEIEQIMIADGRGMGEEAFELDLFVLRRRIERAARLENLGEFYICSLSCRSIIYKGMFLAEQLTSFYPDLLDDRFVSNFAIYHQRYSTNTFPMWRLAQPFRVIAHNGEINTLKGNVNWMRGHEVRIGRAAFGDYFPDLRPIVQPGSSDSAALDAAFEMFVRGGRDLPTAKTALIPEAWRSNPFIGDDSRDMYEYWESLFEPWDGPAAVCGFGGRWAIAGMDRNGLRPLRYTVTGDGLLIAGSETGMVRIEEGDVVEKGRVGPGEMIAVDLQDGKFYRNPLVKAKLAAERPFPNWRERIVDGADIFQDAAPEPKLYEGEELRRRQRAAAMTMEDLELILAPMVDDAKEAIGSMGDDTPLAVLSARYRGLHHFFRQNFSQVTNPPIDSLRERAVMSVDTRIALSGDVDDRDDLDLIHLDSPVLSNAAFAALRARVDEQTVEIDATFPVDSDSPNALRFALDRIRTEAEDAVRGGKSFIIVTDEAQGPDRAAIPSILAAGALHTHLSERDLRPYCSINVRSAECLDVHYFAVLIGVGATTVNAYVAQESIRDRWTRGLFGDRSFEDCLKRFKKAVDDGLLKIMSKMGIAVLASYRGGYNFEAVGLSRSLVAEVFPGLVSRISGIGLTGIQKKALDLHAQAWDADVVALPIGGFYRFRRTGETHSHDGKLIHLLQNAVASDSYSTFQRFSDAVWEQPPTSLRHLLDFKPAETPAPLEDVESITEIRKRFVTPGMSLGALSLEAHGVLNVAMNRIGAKSDSGEGGEDPARFKPDANGDNWNSAIKQVASGRFGVTAEYLNQCREIEIKVAQGAKPGEGGQLPGFKVTAEIAKLRHSTEGVMLISPPPHHDIYSIEDLAQLIYDLKQINPIARVCVKLVSRTGIGTIAAGVAKAKADTILISGHNGGTGASPQTSIKFAGLPWEMGLSEVHQVLTLNNLRGAVRLRTDGGLRTGRDIVMAAMLGAEEFGVGTASLIAMGCIMVRQCHSNTCPVGVCTQDKALRDRFTGTPEKVVNLFTFMAEEVREIVASLGFSSLEEVIGRTDLLSQVSRGSPFLDDLDLNPILARADAGGGVRRSLATAEGRNAVPDTLDAKMIADAQPFFDDGEKMQLAYNVRNTDRAVGARFSSQIVRSFPGEKLRPGHVTVRLRGSAGQSLGAFAVQGLKIEVFGDSNDYVGKGLSGGEIVVRPLTKSPLRTNENTIIGNTVLYGATAGALFAAGKAGERFCVRNSGARAVVEGCGSNGCEYMTGGAVAILGPVGDNFGAGMTGGMAFLYDPLDELDGRINPESVVHIGLETPHWEGVAKQLVADHAAATQSAFAERLLADWSVEKTKFRQVCPKEMVSRLEHPVYADGRRTVAA